MNRIIKKFVIASPSFWFFSVVSLICICVTLWAQHKIVATVDVYEKQIEKMYEASIKDNTNVFMINADSICSILSGQGKGKYKEEKVLKYCFTQIDGYLQKAITQNSDNCNTYIVDIKKVLDNQYLRIRQEYEALQTWCAILTIVFLVFSFYSLYKADDLVRQGRKGLSEIETIKKEGRSNINMIQKEANESITIFKQTIGLELVEINEKMNGVRKKIDESSTKVDIEIKRLSEEIDNKILFAEQEYNKKIQDIISGAEKQIVQDNTEIDVLRAQIESIKNEFNLYKTLNPLY